MALINCPECGARFYAPSAEELAFNSQGACPKCGGKILKKRSKSGKPKLAVLPVPVCAAPITSLPAKTKGIA